jgi:hypothetical protein
MPLCLSALTVYYKEEQKEEGKWEGRTCFNSYFPRTKMCKKREKSKNRKQYSIDLTIYSIDRIKHNKS